MRYAITTNHFKYCNYFDFFELLNPTCRYDIPIVAHIICKAMCLCMCGQTTVFSHGYLNDIRPLLGENGSNLDLEVLKRQSWRPSQRWCQHYQAQLTALVAAVQVDRQVSPGVPVTSSSITNSSAHLFLMSAMSVVTQIITETCLSLFKCLVWFVTRHIHLTRHTHGVSQFSNHALGNHTRKWFLHTSECKSEV